MEYSPSMPDGSAARICSTRLDHDGSGGAGTVWTSRSATECKVISRILRTGAPPPCQGLRGGQGHRPDGFRNGFYHRADKREYERTTSQNFGCLQDLRTFFWRISLSGMFPNEIVAAFTKNG